MSSGLGRSSPRRDPARRNSITDRLRGTFSRAREDTAASIQRRTSSANNNNGSGGGGGKGNPILRIREWLDSCNREHARHCSAGSSAPDVDTFRPARLIDSVERRIVRTQPTDRYVALSYVWGGAGTRRMDAARDPDPSWLVKDNVDVFGEALADDHLPRTIVDAMTVARKLGLRYLWVDKLCIVQDDAEDVDSHVRHMAHVFSNAYLTIVAAHGDVHAGLAPLRPRRSPAQSGSAKGHDALLRQSRWSTRGWTLEEGLYSRRRVYFFEDVMTWECHCDTWEGSPTGLSKSIRGRREGCAGLVSSPALAYCHSPWPDLDQYARISMDYSARRLTSVDDTLRAFSGITHVLSRTFPGGFLYGMPLMFLDVALLWRPQAALRRRAVVRPPFLPSWSWMGWWFDGVPADLKLWRAAADYVLQTATERRGGTSNRLQSPHAFRVTPTVRWSLTDRAASVPVENTGLRFRELRSRRSADAPLPPGWLRSGSSSFKHDSDEHTRFKYPIPVEDPPEDGDYPAPPGETAFPGPYLSFRSWSAFFDVDYDATLSPRDADTKPAVAVGNIWGRTDRWAGSFRAHDGWLGIQSSNYDGDEALEFIAISTATERGGSHVFNDEQYGANSGPNNTIDIVNVLWVERIGGVAYRRGLGHILQKAWDAQPKEEVDVLLG